MIVGEGRFNIYSIFKYLFIAFFTLLIMYPMLHILSVSFSANNEILTGNVTFYPKGFNPSAYKLIWANSRLGPAYLNTLKYTSLSVMLAMFVTTCASYALSKGRRMWGFNFFTSYVLFTMFFSAGMIPTYLTVKAYGLINTTAIIVILGTCSAWNIILMKTFFQSLPKELEDAGKIDGLNDFGVLWYVMLPLSAPIMTTISLFVAVSNWNSFMTPFIYLSSPAKYPVQIWLRQMLLQGTTLNNTTTLSQIDDMILDESIVNATIIVAILPMILIYPFLQKFFTKGMMLGSIKE